MQTTTVEPLHRLCTPTEVATRLGCGLKSIARAMDRGEIQYKRVGNRRRIHEREVRRLLEEGLQSR
jgi:excisionase family DNA binding protein